MAHAIFNARIDLTSVSSTINIDEFNIVGTINDAEGLFNGFDVALNDTVILDTAGTEPGTISKYKVISITSQTFTVLTAKIRYDDVGSPIDPTGAINVPGFICRSSTINSLPWISANDTQGFAQKLVTFASNIISLQKVEAGLMPSNVEQYYAGFGGVTAGRVVRKSGTEIVLADNTSQVNSTVLGIALETKILGEHSLVYKKGRVPPNYITTDCFIENVFPSEAMWVYLANADGKMTVQAPLANSNSWETLIGFWENSSLVIQINQWGLA